ncbi:MAG: hypothetical protein FJ086_05590 [Deltaproteobacteria bacterium]|nr:hypothetical protein [Deltaproteobacteria bacterium]
MSAPRALTLLALLPLSALALPSHAPPHGSVPGWLPRSVQLGTYLPTPFVPQLQLQWEWTLIQERVDALVLVMELGGGVQLGEVAGAGPRRNARMVSGWQAPALLGLAYRGTRTGGFHWGVTVATGPTFFGATFDALPREQGAVGLVEGKVQFGWKAGPATWGLYGGVAQVYDRPARYNAAQWVGGPLLGVFADWR